LATKRFRLEIFLIALAAILVEISLTRIFSFKLYYYFTYLILGIALLGLGSGGVLVAVSSRLREAAPEPLVAGCSLLAGAAIPVCYGVLAFVQVNTIDFAEGWSEYPKLTLICFATFLPFLMIGIALAKIFASRPQDIGRLYFSDLVGAGLGCAICVPLFSTIGPPSAALLAGPVLAAAAASSSLGRGRAVLWSSALLSFALLLLVLFPGFVPDPILDRNKTLSPQKLGDNPILFSSWSSVFRVDVMEHTETNHALVHDGFMGAILKRFDGDLSAVQDFEVDIRSLPYSVLKPDSKVLIIGAAGGHEIVASLYFGAGRITAVELNPVSVSVLTNHFADYSGRIAMNSRVDLINDEGRSFLQRDTNEYDLIWFVAPDSYSALNAASSGAFVLSESYLYTVEMIEESLRHLSDDGVICAQFGEFNFEEKPNRTTRYLATAREALGRLGTDSFGDHVIMSTAPVIFTAATILLKKSPFEPDEVARFLERNAKIEESEVWHAGGVSLPDSRRHPVNDVISLSASALARWHREYPYNVRPVTDDAPFFWHFVRFRDALMRPWGQNPVFWDPEDATGERMLLTLLAFAAAFAGVFLLLPLVLVRHTWREIPHKANAAVYFAGLGLGFMFFEVVLIQKLTLFLGYPTYSLTVTLFSLLIFSGIGSLLSTRYRSRRNRALWRLLAALAVLTLGYQFGVGWLVDAFGGVPLVGRALLTVLLLAPLGLCLGAFMPIGLGTLASLTEHDQEYVAWGWAVNGFFSVVSSVLATILSMAFGFPVVLLLALAVYAAGVTALTRIPEPGPAAS
jgi:predicted membrane-bound spermidine synthase